jgi:hypothetical protein
MGLDAVELVLEIEESFGIKIPDDRASEIETIGELYEFVLAVRPGRNMSCGCLSAATFRMIRRTVCSRLSGKVSRLRPRDQVNSIMPQVGRRRFWDQLQTDLALRFPRLVRPGWLVNVSWGVALTSAASAGCYGFTIGGPNQALLFALVSLIIATAILVVATSPFAVYPDRNFATLRGLTNAVIAYNYAILNERYPTSDREAVWNALSFIIAEQLGLESSELTSSTRFADLGF